MGLDIRELTSDEMEEILKIQYPPNASEYRLDKMTGQSFSDFLEIVEKKWKED
ncbi:MAG: hypothetical protein HY886_09225 [Deltaproteobacteria bacterium]|nr:hypothetical protein [Deltaproteobacteria bacterium]